VKAAY